MIRKVLLLFIALLLMPAPYLPKDAAAGEPRDTHVNSVGMKFVRIAAGEFLMGSPEDEPGRDPSETLHRVRISKDYYLQTTEVTLGQWWAVMGKKIMFGRKGEEQMPVTRISFFDAREFIRLLGKKENKSYRLPTEAEWEYACRAGTRTAYSWGPTIDCDKAMYANSPMKFDQCVPRHRAAGRPINDPAPVAQFAPNPWGLYDMHGNVWEWVSNWFAAYPTTTVTDPKGPASGTHRIRRGGSWFGTGRVCRSANRAYGHPAQRLRTTGFRLVLEVKQ